MGILDYNGSDDCAAIYFLVSASSWSCSKKYTNNWYIFKIYQSFDKKNIGCYTKSIGVFLTVSFSRGIFSIATYDFNLSKTTRFKT